MRLKICLLSFIIMFISIILLFGPSNLYAQVKGPADFSYKQGKDSPGKVTFSHNIHSEEKKMKCTDCHTKIFKLKKGSAKLDMATLNKGESCGKCHNNKVSFSTSDDKNCNRCHKK